MRQKYKKRFAGVIELDYKSLKVLNVKYGPIHQNILSKIFNKFLFKMYQMLF